MAIFKSPVFRGSGPKCAAWTHYLGKEEGREIASLRDGYGHELTSEQAAKKLGGPQAKYWTAIASPSLQECQVLAQRYGGIEQAAQEHGKRLAAQIGRQLRMKEPPQYAYHIEAVRDADGNPTEGYRFHLHFTGPSEPRGKLYGRDGVLQRAWDREWTPDRAQIKDWAKHREFLKLRQELLRTTQEQRQLQKERRASLKVAKNHAEKKAIYEAYKEREFALLGKRHSLELATCNARYAARRTTASAEHQAELQKITNRKNLSLAKAQLRGADSKMKRAAVALSRQTGRAISASKRQALRLAQSAGRAAKKTLEKTKEAVAQHQTKDHLADRTLAPITPLKHVATRATSELATGTLRTGAELAAAAARAAAKIGTKSATATARLGVGVALALPTGGASLGEASKEAAKDLAQGARDAGKEGLKGGRQAAKTAGKTVVATVASGGMGALPPAAQEAVRATVTAGKTAAATVKNLVQLDLLGAAGIAISGGIQTAKHAGAAALHGAKSLPAAVRLPLAAAEKVPGIGAVAKAAKTAAELGHTATAKTISAAKAAEFEMEL